MNNEDPSPVCTPNCALCGAQVAHGVVTNGDGYGDSQYVGIEVPELAAFCKECVRNRSSELPHFEKQIDRAFAERGWCGVMHRWLGRCRNPKPCPDHASPVR